MHRTLPAVTHRPLLDKLKPSLRAFVLGLLSTSGSKVFTYLLLLAKGKLTPRDAARRIWKSIRSEFTTDSFASCCALVIGGATLGAEPFLRLIQKDRSALKARSSLAEICIRYSVTLAFSALAFRLLNRRASKDEEFSARSGQLPSRSLRRGSEHLIPDATYARWRSVNTQATPTPLEYEPRPSRRAPLAGMTMDLTCFVVVRAFDVAVSSSWRKLKDRATRRKLTKAAKLLERTAAPSLFAASSSIVMWAWFYAPERLPPAYRDWISSAAQLDERILEALREIRRGAFVYGKDTGWAWLLQSFCKDYGMPIEWGDPAKTVPIPCELYHSGAGRNCEYHAFTRFARAFWFSFKMYLPLNLLIFLRKPFSARALAQSLRSATQSATFLGAFVALFYYGVCLARTRVGPKVLDNKKFTPMVCDSGYCVATGCAACGWSILLETYHRRPELAFFVAPRALATIVPRRYDRDDMWKEQLAFATSTAAIMTAAVSRPYNVRGVFGTLLARILD